MNEIATTASSQAQDIIAPFDYSVLPPDQERIARDAAQFIDSQHRMMASTAIAIGVRLNAVKAALGHGQFTAWVNASVSITQRTAQNYMAAATALADKSETVSHLPVSTVYEIARAAEPIRAKIIDEMATAPTPVTAKEVSSLIWHAQQAAKDEARIAKLSPAQQKRDKERRAKARAESEASQVRRRKQEAVTERAAVRLAEILLSKLGDDVGDIAALLKETDIRGSELADRLTGNLYGTLWVNYQPQTRSRDEWLEMLAQLEQGENPIR